MVAVLLKDFHCSRIQLSQTLYIIILHLPFSVKPTVTILLICLCLNYCSINAYIMQFNNGHNVKLYLADHSVILLD